MSEENKGNSESQPKTDRKPNTNNNRRPNNNNRKPNANQNKPAGDKPTGNKPNPNKNKNRNRHRRQPTPVDENLKKFVVLNQEGHKQRLNPHYKLDLNSTAKIRITPLGGLGEIG
ncbi:MAG: ribonuclease J, partial [Sulfurimonas sp.]|nr:ribonuclease J [Sulfurimonas sp.]